jgi:hypothetical protein
VQVKKIEYNFIRRIIKDNILTFPSKIKYLNFFFVNDIFVINLINHDGDDVTNLFISKKMPDGDSLYDKIIGAVTRHEKFYTTFIDKDTIYIQDTRRMTPRTPFINGKVFRKLAGMESNQETCIDLGINRTQHWQFKSDIFVNTSIETFLKICNQFKISPFTLLNKEYALPLLKNTLSEFAVSANLTDEEIGVLNKILEKYK